MAFHRFNRFMVGLFLLSLAAGLAAGADRPKPSYSEPELHTLVPLGGRAGSSLEVEVRGKFLAGAHAAWMDHDAFDVRVKSVEPVAAPDAEGDEKAKSKKDDGEYRVRLQIEIASDVTPGPHPLRLVAAGGVSNRLYLQIHQDPVIAESPRPHQEPATAQPVAVPVVVNGTISRQGELDYYSLEASKGQEVAFEVIFSHETLTKGFRPQLRIYETAGSWLGSRKLTQLAFHSEVHGEINLSPGEAGTAHRHHAGQLGIEVSVRQGRPLPGGSGFGAIPGETGVRLPAQNGPGRSGLPEPPQRLGVGAILHPQDRRRPPGSSLGADGDLQSPHRPGGRRTSRLRPPRSGNHLRQPEGEASGSRSQPGDPLDGERTQR